jgi:hypothetical protein
MDKSTSNEPKYAVVASGAKPFLLGRYSTLESAYKAVGENPKLWLIYELKE